jgi:nitrite reductase/ring-hydroxylating ferredoxin subunit
VDRKVGLWHAAALHEGPGERSADAPGAPPLSLVPVARIDEIPTDRGLRVEVEGIGIGLYRVGEAVYAMEDACPHAGVPLSEGTLEGCVITCRAHGWPFDVRTGFDPAHADGFPIPCFAVELRGNEVLVDLAVRINDPRRPRR